MLAPSPEVTPSPGPVPESQHWRLRARECRTLAKRARVDFARERFLKAAVDFDRKAEDAEEREIASGLWRIGELVRDLHRER